MALPSAPQTHTQMSATPNVTPKGADEPPVFDNILLLRAYPDDDLPTAKKKALEAIEYNKKLSETIKASQQEPVFPSEEPPPPAGPAMRA